MKRMKNWKKLICSVAAACMSMTLLIPGAMRAQAADDNNGLGYIDMDKDSTLSVYYFFQAYGDIPAYGKMAGVNAHVVKIADIDKTGQFTVLDAYKSLGFEITDMYSIADQTKWDNIIAEMKKYVVANNTQPDYSAVSGEDGYARLGKVDKGLYFGYSDPITIDGVIYRYWDFLSVVPGPSQIDEEGNTRWNGKWSDAEYDVIAIPKREATRVDEDPVEYNVHKQWVDDGATDRPNSIEVKIYCDGKYVETVKLDSSNDWKYTWKYEKGHVFTVEEVDSGEKYTASVSQSEDTFIIINTKKKPPVEEGDTEDIPGGKKKNKFKPIHEDEETGEVGRIPETVESNPEQPPTDDSSVLGAIRKKLGELPAVLGARRLPQTGQLWWPVPVLVLFGLILIIAGLRSEKKRKSSGK